MNGTNGTTAVLYVRVSSEEQKKGYSLRQKIGRLRDHAAAEGYEVVGECEDPGFSGMFLDRPGLDAARDLIESGAVAVALAQDADRITRKAAHRLTLDEEAGRHGARWVALDDWGDDSHEGKLLRFMKGWAAEGESLKTAERSRRGARRKVAEGALLGASPRPRYGFRYVHDGEGRRIGYEPDPQTMRVVLRIFELLAGGHPLKAVAAALDADGVPTPRGGMSWSRRTLREMTLDAVYRPHSVGELAGRVSADVLARLDPAGSYGVAYSGRVRTRKVSNASRVREKPQPEEWVGVPVRLDGSGLDAATVDWARAAIRDNRSPRPVGDRFFELAGGPLRCAHCGRRMIGYARRHKDKRPNPYYRCDSPSRVAEPCPNRRSHPADALEYEAASLFEQIATRGALLDLYDRAIEEQGRASGLRDSQHESAALSTRLAELDEERAGYLRQNARGIVSDAELDGLLAGVGARREEIAGARRRAEDAAAAAHRLQAARQSLAAADWVEDPEAVRPDQWLTLAATPEEVRRSYQRFGARFKLDSAGDLALHLEVELGAELEGVADKGHAHGNEHWEFDAGGLMRRRDASINDYEIRESERRFRS